MKRYNMDDLLKKVKDELIINQKTPEMWNEIYNEIHEQKSIISTISEFVNNYRYQVSFAVTFAILIFISFTIFKPFDSEKMISISEAAKLADKIDKDVFKAQKIYEQVISEMEQNCTVTELTTKNDLAQAFFDKLYLLDQVIVLCKSSLEDNPYNSEIHKQLFYAYNEKIKVYKEIQNLNIGSLS